MPSVSPAVAVSRIVSPELAAEIAAWISDHLFEYLDVGQHYGTAPFDAFDQETAMDALREVDRLSREDFAQSFVDSDRIPLKLEDGEIERVLESVQKRYFDDTKSPARKALDQSRRLGHEGIVTAIRLLARADLDLRGATALDGRLVLNGWLAPHCYVGRLDAGPGIRCRLADGSGYTPAGRGYRHFDGAG